MRLSKFDTVYKILSAEDQSKQRYSEKAHWKGYHMIILFAKKVQQRGRK